MELFNTRNLAYAYKDRFFDYKVTETNKAAVKSCIRVQIPVHTDILKKNNLV